MWTGCVKYVDCHVCWGVSHISPRYVNPSVSPPQGAAQAWRISAHCPADKVWVLTTLPTCAIKLHANQKQFLGWGAGAVQSTTCLDHGNCLYTALILLNLLCTCSERWFTLVKQLPFMIFEQRGHLCRSWEQCGDACPQTKKKNLLPICISWHSNTSVNAGLGTSKTSPSVLPAH